ncbi:unnamed protein product, partial [Pylaiella littoralis]
RGRTGKGSGSNEEFVGWKYSKSAAAAAAAGTAVAAAVAAAVAVAVACLAREKGHIFSGLKVSKEVARRATIPRAAHHTTPHPTRLLPSFRSTTHPRPQQDNTCETPERWKAWRRNDQPLPVS